MEGYTKMHSASSPSPPVILKSKLLLTCSIINILVMSTSIVRVALLIEDPDPFYDDPSPAVAISMILFILTGILGFSASYTPKRPLIISALIFSCLSMCFALLLCFGLGETCSTMHCTFYNSYNSYSKNGECNALLFHWSLAVVSSINNIIVTVLLSKAICKCCARPTVSTSIPIATVHNPPVNNLQNLTPTWAVPLTGQQPQQFQSSSYPTVVIYSPYPQQPSMNQQEQHQPPSGSFSTGSSITGLMNSLTNVSPPPYSTVVAFEPQLSERKLH